MHEYVGILVMRLCVTRHLAKGYAMPFRRYGHISRPNRTEPRHKGYAGDSIPRCAVAMTI